MRIDCIHGYFKFTEEKAGQLSDFISTYGFDIERNGDHYTFSSLVDAPKYCIKGVPYLGLVALVTFEGEPWEILRENGFVYDFILDVVLPLETVAAQVSLSKTAHYFVTTGMILPGSITDDRKRVTDYSAFFVKDRMNFKYSEVTSE